MNDDAQRFSVADLEAWAGRIFERVSVPADEAAIIAEALARASLRGVDTHGIIYAPVYVRDILKGKVNAQPNIRLERDGPATALVNGDGGLGIVVGVRAMHEAIGHARAVGTAVVGARNSTHFGAVAYYAQLAAAEGLIGLSCTNVEPVMAPWGSRSLFLGNNPFAIAAPGGIDGGVVLDMATTKVAWGKMYLAARAGRKIPLGWATDKAGQPTDDPNVGMQGLMLPLGGHKGYGLAVMVEILCSALTGAAFDHQIVDGQNLGHLFIAIDIARFIPAEPFQTRLAQLVDEIHACQPVEEGSRIYVPGEIEAETAVRRRREGIPVPAGVVAELMQLGEELGEPFLR